MFDHIKHAEKRTAEFRTLTSKSAFRKVHQQLFEALQANGLPLLIVFFLFQGHGDGLHIHGRTNNGA